MKKKILVIIFLCFSITSFTQKKTYKFKEPITITYIDLEKNFSKEDIGKMDLRKGYSTKIFNSNKNEYHKFEIERKAFYLDSTIVTKDSWLSKLLKNKLSENTIQGLKYVPYHIKKPEFISNNDSIYNKIAYENFKKTTHILEKKNNVITVDFVVNGQNKISRVYSSTGIKSLNKKIADILFKIPIKKFGLTKKSNRGVYTIQLFEYKDNNPFINASTRALKIGTNNTYIKKNNYLKKSEKEKKLYKDLSNPNTESWLANFLHQELNRLDIEDLEAVRYISIKKTDSIKKEYNSIIKNNIIKLSFKVNDKNEVSNVSVKTGIKDINSKLKRAFKKFARIKKLGLTKKNNSGRYSVQLYEYNNDTIKINASSIAIKEEKPILKKCIKSKQYLRKRCFKEALHDHLLKNISLKIISDQKLKGKILYTVRFKINPEGKITEVETEVSNEILKKEINRIIKTFNEEIIPAKRNNLPIPYNFETKSYFFIDEN